MSVRYEVIPHTVWHVVRFEDGKESEDCGQHKSQSRAELLASALSAREIGSAANTMRKFNPPLKGAAIGSA